MTEVIRTVELGDLQEIIFEALELGKNFPDPRKDYRIARVDAVDEHTLEIRIQRPSRPYPLHRFLLRIEKL